MLAYSKVIIPSCPIWAIRIMKFCNLFFTGALTICTRAWTNDEPNNDPPIASFAAYGLPGCSQNSQKNFTLVQTEESRCYVFTPPFPTNIQSAVTTNIIHGCVGKLSFLPGSSITAYLVRLRC